VLECIEVSEGNSDPPNTFSTVDFPALTAHTPQEQFVAGDAAPSQQDDRAREKAELKAAKKAAAAERAAERQRIAQEKAALRAAEKAKASQEKAAEKERLAALKAEQEKVERDRIQKEKEERARAKAEIERQLQLEKSKTTIPPVPEPGKSDGKKVADKVSDGQKRSDVTPVNKMGRQIHGSKVHQSVVEPPTVAEPAPLLSKKPKKNKPVAKPLRIVKEGDQTEDATSSVPSPSEVHPVSAISVNTTASVLRSQLSERNSPTPLEEIFDELDICYPWMDLVNHPFFDSNKVNPAAKMPLEYGPLVHALSTLSVGGGSFANNMPSGSIDNAVSSFQQLLETLTQTISDLLRLLPRTTWDDSSSFDGVLRDMLKGDDFLDDAGEEGHNKEDEVAALTLALERRARWMEVQLSKLEELHRDINLAAVRAVLSFNDNGWDRNGFLPRISNTLRRYDGIGVVEDGKVLRPMSIDELEKKLIVAREATVFAETEVKEAMANIQCCKPLSDYYY
jgi:CCR4-NOT transcription complex subunit 4